ncbi:MAG: DUF2062 domain-containing protein [Pseudomonadota bacterium]|nr:MAG: hypothetical protein DIU78_21640 [Pseudomonadota bacterium]
MLKRLWQRLRGVGSPARLGASVGLGLFIGCLPLYGLHLPLCLLVCLPFRLDVVAAYLAAHVSNPLFAPFLLLAEAELGAIVLGRLPITTTLESMSELGWDEILVRTAVGSVVLGALLGASGGALAAGIARGRSTGGARVLDGARRRTVDRYRAAPLADRWYVAIKLATDPVVEQGAALGPLGDVLDVGCGRGQLGLFLFELGNVSRLVGFDLDARKVEVARTAGGEDATFSSSDVAHAELPAADTVLLIDVLHYLPLAEQDALLERAARTLRPSGRLVIREVEGRAGVRARITGALERIAMASGYNRTRHALAVRPSSEVVSRLEALGLECERVEASSGVPFRNVLIVARAQPRNLHSD